MWLLYHQRHVLLILLFFCTTLIVLYVGLLSDKVNIIIDKFNMIKHTRWIVIDDVTATCDDVTTFTDQQEWAVVIVTERETYISGCKLPNCFQLTWTYFTENMNHFETSRFLSEPSKLSGYLYAMQNGAKVILDADCSNQVKDVTKHFRIDEVHQSGLWTNDTQLFNPFHYYGFLDSFPLEIYAVKQNNLSEDNSDKFYLSEWSSVPVRQGVIVSHSTCVKVSEDAVHKQNLFPHGPPVSVGYPSLSPFSTGPSVFYEDVFTLLFTPPKMELEVGKLFRTLWFHQLNKLSLITSAFYYIRDEQEEFNDCCYNKDVSRYSGNIDSLSTCLDKVNCGQQECTANILKQLSVCFAKEFYNATDDLGSDKLFQSWNSDLLKLGYKRTITNTSEMKQRFKAKYQIPNQLAQFRNLSLFTVDNITKDVISMCGKNETLTWANHQKMSNPPIDDIALIISFNNISVFPSLGFNEFVHRQYFKYIVYCVPSLSEFDEYAKKAGFDYVTFIDALSDGWMYFYQCASGVMTLNLPVKGYLQIGDDVLLNDWNVITIPRNEFIMFSDDSWIDLYKINRNFTWKHWNPYYGQRAVQNVIAELQNAPLLSLDEQLKKYPRVNISLFAKNFLSNLDANIKPKFVAFGSTDIFYVPHKLLNEYLTAEPIFRKHLCMTEVAVKTMFLGLVRDAEKKNYFLGDELWGSQRNQSWRFFNSSNIFIHPLKWIADAHTREGTDFLCQRYFALL